MTTYNIQNKNKLVIKQKRKFIKKKFLFNFYDLFIKELQQKGTHFFALTLNFLGDQEESRIRCNEIIGTKYTRQQWMDIVINDTNKMISNIEMIDFTFTTIETSKRKNDYHALILIGIRSITENHKEIEVTILDILNSYQLLEGIQLYYLKEFLDIKRYMRYQSKELHIIDSNINNFYYYYFSKQNESIHIKVMEHFGENQTTNEQLDTSNYDELADYFKFETQIKGKYDQLSSFNFNVQKINQKMLLIYYINIYLMMNNMFFNNNNLYIKNHNTLFSYIYLGNYYYIIKILPDIVQFYNNYFESINFSNLWTNLINNINQIEYLLKKNNHLVYNEKINYNVIEFNDGIYIMEYDYFIHKKELEILNLNKLKCIRYYNQTYNNLQNKKRLEPKTWMKYLNDNIKNENINEFCTKFGKYFFLENDINKDKSNKKNTLFIQGNSNSGKTALLTNQLINSWGPQKIAMITDQSNFAFENIQKKKNWFIENIFRSDKKHGGNVLKMLENNYMSVNRKFKQSEIGNYNSNFMFLGNYTPENLNMLEDLAFKNRLDIYDFKQELNLNEKEIIQIKKEEPKIIIYCNKLFLKQKNYNKKKRINKLEKQEIIKKLT